MATRVLLLTQWFDPEPTFKGLVFARELAQQGFDVQIITGFPNYPGGKIYSGYKIKWVQHEFIDGVQITRVPLYPSHNQSAIGRVFNYISFAVSALFYCLFRVKRPDVIYAYHPPLTVGVVAAITRLCRRIPVVYDVQDMWPDTLRVTGMLSNDKILKVVASICNWVYRQVDQIVVLSPGFKRLLIDRGVAAEKIEIIYNWCSESTVVEDSSILPFSFPGPETFRILFAGNMGKAQALSSVIDAADEFQAEGAAVTFIFLGGGVEVDNLQELASRKILNNVIFLPPVPMSEVGAYLAAADVLLVHLKKDPLFSITIPSKTQAYMSAGKPILMAVEGDAANLVVDSKCGLIAEPENSVSLKKAIAKIMQLNGAERVLMADNGKRFYNEKLALNVGVRSFGAIFNRLKNTKL